MSGTTLLLATCVAAVCGWAVVLIATLRRPEDERTGLYGSVARRRRLDADSHAAELRRISERAALDELAGMVVVLDRLAWHGVPVMSARRDGVDATWIISFGDGTTLKVRTDDVAEMRRAAVLSHTDPLVVSRVHPDGTRARVVMWTPRHGAVAVSVAP